MYGKRHCFRSAFLSGAGNEIRTRYLHLGKVALCQMSYARISNAGVIISNRIDLSRGIYPPGEKNHASVSRMKMGLTLGSGVVRTATSNRVMLRSILLSFRKP